MAGIRALRGSVLQSASYVQPAIGGQASERVVYGRVDSTASKATPPQRTPPPTREEPYYWLPDDATGLRTDMTATPVLAPTRRQTPACEPTMWASPGPDAPPDSCLAQQHYLANPHVGHAPQDR